jgi:hypothetical protein
MKFCKTIFKRNWTEQDFIDNEPDIVLESAELNCGPTTEEDKIIAQNAYKAVLEALNIERF